MRVRSNLRHWWLSIFFPESICGHWQVNDIVKKSGSTRIFGLFGQQFSRKYSTFKLTSVRPLPFDVGVWCRGIVGIQKPRTLKRKVCWAATSRLITKRDEFFTNCIMKQTSRETYRWTINGCIASATSGYIMYMLTSWGRKKFISSSG